MDKLEVGEKYLTISILGSIKVAAFKNKNKTESKQPDYVGNGVAVWISEKRLGAIEKPSFKGKEL